MELRNDQTLICCGDEPLKPEVEMYAVGSEWMLHEAFCLYSQADIFDPYEKHHSTVKDVCNLAERLGVKNLLLYHTEDKNLTERKKLYIDEGTECFHGKLWVPNDLESIILQSTANISVFDSSHTSAYYIAIATNDVACAIEGLYNNRRIMIHSRVFLLCVQSQIRGIGLCLMPTVTLFVYNPDHP